MRPVPPTFLPSFRPLVKPNTVLKTPPAQHFSGTVSKSSLGKAMIVLGLLGLPGSTYLGLTHMKQGLKQPVRTHILKAADHTVTLLREDAIDLQGELKGVDFVDMDAVKHDAAVLAKKEAAALASAAKDKATASYKSVKEKLTKMMKGENVEHLEEAVSSMSLADREALEKELQKAEPTLESVTHFKAKLAEVSRNHWKHSNLSHENYKPIIDAAFDDIGAVVVHDGTWTATGVSASIMSVILGMLLLMKKPE